MKIKNGHDEVMLTRDVLNMTSVDRHIIKLPYTGKLNGDMLCEAFCAALSGCFSETDSITIDSPKAFENVVESVSAFIVPHIQPRYCGAVMELFITATDGNTATKKLVLDIEPVELIAIMEGFLRDGNGLDTENKELIKTQYEAWFERVTA